ncbi:NADP-dependent oxidoreductase [Roseateles asaccharophilus]|uniref:NADPH-dependent curcumin reductase CurA n=1 Tax=Roseateles asaccharophilus TaxID=582607 RepID=A0ABU2A8G2_9BURK|nr:NADP-dependent oxidoreductase [Roseateles asaccharophilus]MDR7333305.1 NADPH-dependent curcumin reductase CurA [Roseateles asaccharophilus]
MNRRLTLASHPQGLPGPEHFRLDVQPLPEAADGQVLLRTLYLSIDPYMRNLLAPIGPGYAPPVPLGGVIVGGTVSQVVESRHAGFQAGELVLANAGWQDYATSDGSDLLALGDMAQPSLALGGLGMPGFTAYVGLLDIAQPQPGETVVVAAATGAVGSVVGQLAKLKGARVVGIAGGAEKCRHAVEVLGFDACIDRHAPDLAGRLAAACPQGIDVYFENVGGDVLAAVLPLLNLLARVPVCGFIAHYNDTAAPAPGPDLATLLARRIKLQGFIILDHYGERFDAFRRDMAAWLAEGRIRLREDVVDGLEQAPAALARLLQGGNFGKTVVRVAGGPGDA